LAPFSDFICFSFNDGAQPTRQLSLHQAVQVGHAVDGRARIHNHKTDGHLQTHRRLVFGVELGEGQLKELLRHFDGVALVPGHHVATAHRRAVLPGDAPRTVIERQYGVQARSQLLIELLVALQQHHRAGAHQHERLHAPPLEQHRDKDAEPDDID
jgi:hypothetical protein